jgi:Tol biopolymer transport system component
MPLLPGTRLGPYVLTAPLGAGGMGEVYAARDSRLDRTVAIKVLLHESAGDAGRRARFEREATAIASLQHPNICTLYDVGDHDGAMFLVMEKLDGVTLAARLAAGPLTPAEAIACAMQIAEGLAFAHRAGVVHRDLKPANVMLTRSGARLLDFGLAKMTAAAGTIAATNTSLTVDGELLGTLPYMAPEQLEGKDVDARADVFAFGAMLHEMVTGVRPFAGDSQASLIAAILHHEPPALSQVVPNAPRALDRLVRVCLAKNREDRWSAGQDVLLNLKVLSESHGPETSGAARTAALRRRERLAWALAIVGLAAAAGLGWRASTVAPPPDARSDLLSIVPPQDSTFARGEAPQISPDGRHLAFVSTDHEGVRGLYLRSLDSAIPRFLAGTENGAQPFWSPDSRMLGFFADGQLKTVSLSGGTPQVLARVGLARGGSWSKDNLILFLPRPNVSLAYIPASGGEPTSVPTPPKLGVPGFPTFLPDGRHYLFTQLNIETRLVENLMIGSLDSPETRRLVGTTSSGLYAAGHLLYRRNTTLLAQAFDLDALEVRGDPIAVAEGVGANPVTYQALFSASATGMLAFRDAAPGAELAWFARSGVRLSTVAPPGEFNTVCMTPDGRRIVFDQADANSGHIDLWMIELSTLATTQLTFAGPVEFYPVCGPSSREIALAALKPNNPNLFRLTLAAPGQMAAILESPLPKLPTDWSRDGGQLVYSVLTPGTGWDIASFDFASGESRALIATAAEEHSGKLSPDGRWLAYVSNESGRFELYVRPMSGSGAKWLVSRGSATQPQWSADGRSLYYIAQNRRLMVVQALVEGNTFAPSAPVVLMDAQVTSWEFSIEGAAYAVTPDGGRILISTATDTGRPVSVLSNWTGRLR